MKTTTNTKPTTYTDPVTDYDSNKRVYAHYIYSKAAPIDALCAADKMEELINDTPALTSYTRHDYSGGSIFFTDIATDKDVIRVAAYIVGASRISVIAKGDSGCYYLLPHPVIYDSINSYDSPDDLIRALVEFTADAARIKPYHCPAGVSDSIARLMFHAHNILMSWNARSLDRQVGGELIDAACRMATACINGKGNYLA